ncbi:outer membrane lipoprotein chaperone LolA [Reinekea thalattae]|nr:outer membrane lipoprotein chaperone LolA [Reinekea thalattae]
MRYLAFILSALLLAPWLSANEADKEQLIKSLEQFSTVSALFSQKTYAESSFEPEQLTGYFKVEKPLKFLWMVTAPYEQQVLSDGEMLWVYDPDLEQATYQAVDQQVQHSPAMILSEPRQTLSDQYQVLRVVIDDEQVYQLIPFDEDSVFTEMQMTLNDESIKKIVILDSLGQRTEIEFSQFSANQPIDPSAFQFNPPPGTDLFEQL